MIDDPAGRSHDPLTVLSQGEGWLIIAKPPRLLVHRNPRMRHSDAALQRVRRQVGRWVYPIHRLDRNTSGCLLFATDPDLAGPLSAALQADDAEKIYLAHVRGCVVGDGPVRVDKAIKYSDGHYKEASSVLRRLGSSTSPRSSLLEVRPETGRNHQVRRHVRDLGHPVLGDGDHGDSRVNREWRERFGLDRLGLHCLSLSIPAPGGGRIAATCPLFEDQAALYRQLPWWSEALARCPDLGRDPLPLLIEARDAPCYPDDGALS